MVRVRVLVRQYDARRLGYEIPPVARPRPYSPDRQDEKTAGGIIIPDTAKEKPMEGEVVAAGPGARSEEGKIQPLDVKVGDRVLFGKWSGTEIKLDGEDLMIMKESDLMGVIEGKTSSKHKAA